MRRGTKRSKLAIAPTFLDEFSARHERTSEEVTNLISNLKLVKPCSAVVLGNTDTEHIFGSDIKHAKN